MCTTFGARHPYHRRDPLQPWIPPTWLRQSSQECEEPPKLRGGRKKNLLTTRKGPSSLAACGLNPVQWDNVPPIYYKICQDRRIKAAVRAAVEQEYRETTLLPEILLSVFMWASPSTTSSPSLLFHRCDCGRLFGQSPH
jgi:hypothetical protein